MFGNGKMKSGTDKFIMDAGKKAGNLPKREAKPAKPMPKGKKK